MRLIGWCTGCHRFKYVRVSGQQIALGAVCGNVHARHLRRVREQEKELMGEPLDDDVARNPLAYIRVCEERCETCIFSPRSPISPERRRDYEGTWRRKDTFQNCHHGTVTGDKALMCRGFYDWCESIQWWPTALQLGERLNRIRFVAVPPLP